MSHFLGLIIFAGIALLNILAKRAERGGSSRQPTRPSNPPARQRPLATREESDEERMRRFMEALGLPAGTSTPTPVKPRSAAGPQETQESMRPVQPPRTSPARTFTKREIVRRETITKSLGRRTAEVEKQRSPLPATTAFPETVTSVPEFRGDKEGEAAVASALQAVTQREAAVEVSGTLPVAAQITGRTESRAVSVRKLLQNSDSVRTAFILKEVLGPPKALQS